MKHSAWVTGAKVVQFFVGFALLAFSIYLLVLTRNREVTSAKDAAEDISGLKIAAIMFGVPAVVVLVGAFALWKDKLWGWWLALFTNAGLTAVLTYGLIDDGWEDIDPSLILLTLATLLPVVILLVPGVRRFYWSGVDAATGTLGSARLEN